MKYDPPTASSYALKPIAIPDDGNERVINVSGGRTSAYMLAAVLAGCGGQLPPRTRAIFANTGKEREETLVFLDQIERRWGVPITWLEYRYDSTAAGGRTDPKTTFTVVNFRTASRRGQPFTQLIRRAVMLPCVVQRKCTQELKVLTMSRYVRRELGIRKHRALVGIRRDENARAYRMLTSTDCRVEVPLWIEGITEDHVLAFWASQPFDLRIGSHEGNCDLCFLKGKKNLTRLIGENPDSAEWWADQERWVSEARRWRGDKKHFTFRQQYSYDDLLAWAKEGAGVEDDGSISCFCGD